MKKLIFCALAAFVFGSSTSEEVIIPEKVGNEIPNPGDPGFEPWFPSGEVLLLPPQYLRTEYTFQSYLPTHNRAL